MTINEIKNLLQNGTVSAEDLALLENDSRVVFKNLCLVIVTASKN